MRTADSRARILLLGCNGQVGWELARALTPIANLVSPDREQLDLSDVERVRKFARDTSADIIVNAAAYTNVDRAESEEDVATRLNADAPQALADVAREQGALMVHYSTDYVFNGAASHPYTESDAVAPLNAYGRSKLAGEQAVHASGADAYIFRISWVYALRGRNFLRTVRRLAAGDGALRIVADQRGAPTWARVVAEATAAALVTFRAARAAHTPPPPFGVYHMTAPDHTTWHGFADAIVRADAAVAGKPPKAIVPITTADFSGAVVRSPWSVLDSGKLRREFGLQLPPWLEQLRLCLADSPDRSG